MPQPSFPSATAGSTRPGRHFMWLTPDRVLYAGLLGATAARTMGCVTVYAAARGAIRLRIGDGDWQSGAVGVVPPYVPHRVATDGGLVHALKIEAETVDPDALPEPLTACGALDDAAFARRLRERLEAIGAQGRDLDLASADFDNLLFGQPLGPRRLDARVRRVVDAIKRDPSVMAAAEGCAESVHLSFSRFLHLFRREVGAPFRAFRTWKRARSLLHHVNRDINLTHVALDTGYPDSTHFSHSIRQVYGLKPKDIFAGSRRLVIYAPAPPGA